MNQNTTDHLAELFTIFDIDELGHGDPVAGANTLAAMCLPLAGVSRAGSCVLSANGRRMPIGVSALVSGSASSASVVDEVTLEIGRCQNLWIKHLARLCETIEEMKSKPASAIPFSEPVENLAESSYRSLLNNEAHSGEPREYDWKTAMSAPPREWLPSFLKRPVFFVTTVRADNLPDKLAAASQRPFVHLVVSRPSELAEFGETVGSLLDGCASLRESGEILQGNVLLTDPLNTLAASADTLDGDTAWLSRILWLSDSDAGPVATAGGATPAEAASGDLLTERFRKALEEEIGLRQGVIGQGVPRAINMDLREVQRRWTKFLRGMEGRLPGISGAARNLPATLAYGLVLMGGVGLGLTLAHVEAFARYLVERMANARASILQAGEITLRRTQIQRVFNKLSSIPMYERKIYQNLGLPADDCRGCLRWLEAANLARPTDDGWIRVDGACLSFNGHPFPLLEA